MAEVVVLLPVMEVWEEAEHPPLSPLLVVQEATVVMGLVVAQEVGLVAGLPYTPLVAQVGVASKGVVVQGVELGLGPPCLLVAVVQGVEALKVELGLELPHPEER